MEEPVSTIPPPAPRRPQRAWWQWVLGLSLIIFALGTMVIRWIERNNPQWLRFHSTVDPLPLKLQPGTKEGQVVPAAPGSFAGHNVLLITLDTTRPDRLGCYGNDEIKTPSLDRIAREGILFSKAFAVAPTTLPSHSSMMTSLYPYHHGARRNGSTHLTPNQVTLAEVLSEKGYATGAAVSAFVINSCFGISQGFGFYDDEVTHFPDAPVHREAERRGDHTTDKALAWLKDHSSGPFFFWLHLYDAHSPYEPPEPFASEYDHLLYDGEIAFVDTQVARVLKWLDDAGLTDKTIVGVMGDHGESLGEHDEYSHGLLIYDATIRVPYLLRCGNRLGGGLHISHPVSTVDFMPTVLTMLGVPVPENCEGVNLANPASPSRLIYGETLEGFYQHGLSPLLSVRDSKYKYIYGPAPEVFDVVADPNELTDLVAKDATIAADMKQKLALGFGNNLEEASFSAATQEVSADDMEKIKALGYADGGFTAPPKQGALADPKQVMGLLERVRIATEMDSVDERPEAIAKLEKLAEDNPDFFPLFKTLADLNLREKDFYGAQKAYQRCLEIYPDLPFMMQALASAYTMTGQFDEAIDQYKAALKVSPGLRTAWGELGTLLLHAGRNNEALEHLEQAIRLQPDSIDVADSLVNAAVAAHRVEPTINQLITMLRQSTTASPGIRVALAGLLAKNQQVPQSLAIFREGVRVAPNDMDLASSFATHILKYESQPRLIDEAVQIAESLCEKTKNENIRYLRILSFGYEKRGQKQKAIEIALIAREAALKDSRLSVVEDIDANIQALRASKSPPGDAQSPSS